MSGDQASFLRQRLLEQAAILMRLAREGLGREPLIQGSLYLRQRRCGKRTCRCARGMPHQSLVLAVGSGRRRRVLSVGCEEEGRAREWIERWRRVRGVRKEMAAAFQKLARTFDELNRLRCKRASELRLR